jgi:hypothetical protein
MGPAKDEQLQRCWFEAASMLQVRAPGFAPVPAFHAKTGSHFRNAL